MKTTPTAPAPAPVAAVAPAPVASPATRLALEFDSLLALFASEARTDLGAAVLRALEPAADEAELRRRRARYEELERLTLEAPLVPGLGEGFGELVARLESGDPPLAGSEILRLAGLLAAGGEAAARIARIDPPCAELGRAVAELADPQPLVRRIGSILDRKGEVRDDASPRLAALRRQVQGARERIYGRLEEIGGAHREFLGEETVPMRGGRLMLMVQAGNRGKLAGLVHGRSATGKSLYFEPLEVVEENNTLQSAVDELEGERQRLLYELLRDLAAEAPLVRSIAGLVGDLDALEASRRLAREIDAHLPVLAAPGTLRLIAARHPLLDPRLARRRERVLGARGHEGAVEPLGVALTPERRALVITGPNAGGKTVALKTLGLLALAAQAGLPIPAAAASEVPFLANLVATVGDEQDLLADRSTFSGRLARLAEAYRAAGPQSLALLDELGSGTDPEEGHGARRGTARDPRRARRPGAHHHPPHRSGGGGDGAAGSGLRGDGVRALDGTADLSSPARFARRQRGARPGAPDGPAGRLDRARRGAARRGAPGPPAPARRARSDPRRAGARGRGGTRRARQRRASRRTSRTRTRDARSRTPHARRASQTRARRVP
jgi:DNA mismatch repair protein MutS2